MKITVCKTLLAVAAVSSMAGAAFAEPASGALKIGSACKTDISTICSAAAKGAERARCLRENQAKVSPDCAKAIAAKPAKWGMPKAPKPAATAPAPAATTTPPAATTTPPAAEQK